MGNPEDRFSRGKAHVIHVSTKISCDVTIFTLKAYKNNLKLQLWPTSYRTKIPTIVIT